VVSDDAVKTGRCAGSISWKRRPEPQGHGSLRPSFSRSSLWPWTIRWPRFTCASEGKPLLRLLLGSKAVEGIRVD